VRHKLASHRQLLEQDANIAVLATWIAEVERERKRLGRELGRKPAARKLTKTEIKALVRRLKSIVAVPADADPAAERAIYDPIWFRDGRCRLRGSPENMAV
jgi:hypothetical protein